MYLLHLSNLKLINTDRSILITKFSNLNKSKTTRLNFDYDTYVKFSEKLSTPNNLQFKMVNRSFYFHNTKISRILKHGLEYAYKF